MTAKVVLDGDNYVLKAGDTMSGNLLMQADDIGVYFGVADDASILFDGSDLIIKADNVTAGDGVVMPSHVAIGANANVSDSNILSVVENVDPAGGVQYTSMFLSATADSATAALLLTGAENNVTYYGSGSTHQFRPTVSSFYQVNNIGNTNQAIIYQARVGQVGSSGTVTQLMGYRGIDLFYDFTSPSAEWTNAYVFFADNVGSFASDLATGVYVAKQTGATVNRGIFLSGDGAGSDIVFGTDADASIMWDAADLLLSPGAGRVKVDGHIVVPDDNDGIGIGVFAPVCGLDVRTWGGGSFAGGFATAMVLAVPDWNSWNLVYGNETVAEADWLANYMDNSGNLHFGSVDNYSILQVRNQSSIQAVGVNATDSTVARKDLDVYSMGNNDIAIVNVTGRRAFPLTGNGSGQINFNVDGTISDFSTSKISSYVDVDSGNGGYMVFLTGAAGNVATMTLTATNEVQIPADNKGLYFGAAQDASIQYNGNDLVITANLVTATDGLIIPSHIAVGNGGAAPSEDIVMNFQEIFTDPSVLKRGIVAATFYRGDLADFQHASADFSPILDAQTASTAWIFGIKSLPQYTGGAYTLDTCVGGVFGSLQNSGTITNARAASTQIVVLGGTTTNGHGFYAADGFNFGTLTNLYGVYIEGQTAGANNYGLVLAGDGAGSDIVFGAAQDASILYDGTDLVIDPALVGSGVVNVAGGLTVDDDAVFSGEVSGQKVLLEGANNVSSQTGSIYMDLHNGMPMTDDRGHPVPRAGSVTGVAANLTVNSYTPGAELHMQVRVNGVEVFSCNQVIAATGYQSWFATQARGVDTFSAGDLIMLYIETVGTASWSLPSATAEVILDA